MSSLLIHSGQLVTEQVIETSDLLIEDGTLTEVGIGLDKVCRPLDKLEESEVVDASGLLIFPGFIDCHVHFREPGMPDAEDMETGSLSALNGGVTTVCEMPNTNPPTSSVEALQYKLDRAQQIYDSSFMIHDSKTHGCDCRFFFNVMSEEHLQELMKVNPDDIAGVKIYLDHSTGDRKVEEGILDDLFSYCAEKDIVIVGHCEDPEMNDKARENYSQSDVAAHSIIRPPESEAKSIEFAINLAKNNGTHFHVAHLSTSFGIDLVSQAKKDGLNVTCEVAPHHLFLSIDDYDHLGTFCKMNPPVRTPDHREALWKGIDDGIVDCIATDHAPHPLINKQVSEPLTAPSGVPGVETMIPLLLSCVNDGPMDTQKTSRSYGVQLAPTDILRLCQSGPNRVYKLGKPQYAIGKPADIVLVNPLEKWTIHEKTLHSRCGWTPYEGWEMTGKIVKVVR